jgi:glycyl-tRNA synthetase
VTYDFDSEQDHKVTVRERDSTEQERLAVEQLPAYLSERILGF